MCPKMFIQTQMVKTGIEQMHLYNLLITDTLKKMKHTTHNYRSNSKKVHKNVILQFCVLRILLKFKRINFQIVFSLLVIGFFQSCNDDWNQHFTAKYDFVSNKTIWDEIKSNPELTIFARILEENNYDQILSNSQMYTVWAPTDSSLIEIDFRNRDIVTEFIENHIARFSYSILGNIDEKITMLNDKVIKLKFENGKYMFGNIEIISRNKVVNNGILHIIKSELEFYPNIWEFLPKETGIDSICKYLYSFNQLIFDEKNSIPGDVNESGQTVYLDSVFINSNKMFKTVGFLNNEDSVYNIIIPNNNAWNSSYTKIKEYFRFYNQNQSIADTLQRHYTSLALVRDLSFSQTIQLSPADSLTSTSRNVFYQPAYLFDNSRLVNVSNGKIFITNELLYKHYDSWNKKIIVEAEKITGRENTLSSVYTRSSSGGLVVPGISGSKYLEISPTSSASNPTVTFEIPNTLSAAYNIYCVFVPKTISNTPEADLKSCKAYFQLTYLKENGSSTTQNFTVGDFVSEKDKLHKMLVTSNFKFPFANYGQDIVSVKLKVISNVKQNETTLYTRDMLIDCIVLEPVH